LKPEARDLCDLSKQPGDDTYLCTFPSHYNLGMNGKLVLR
jgi:hypothetical protein